jgi:small-conductance mechanosensitive channel
MILLTHLRARCIALLFACLLLPGVVTAQVVDDAYMQQWDSMVERVDRVLAADIANDATLERLRRQVADFRDSFLADEGANRNQIDRIQRQLDSLGPAPAEGETEPQDVADRRAALQEELTRLRAPSLRAGEAFAAADALVSELDNEIRNRKARQVLQRFPLPVNPLNWEEPLLEMNGIALSVPAEVIDRLSDPETRREILGNLPSAALSLIGGTLMVFRSRAWSGRIARRINAIRKPVPRKLLQLVIVLAELALPWIGLTLLVGALQLTGIFGPTGTTVLLSVVAFGFSMILGTWLVGQLFPRLSSEDSPLMLAPRLMPKARRMAYLMVVTLSIYQGLSLLAQRTTLDTQTAAYSGFVLSLLTAYGLFRLSRFFRRTVAETQGEASDRAFAEGVVAVLATSGMIASIVAVVAGLAGYVLLSRQVIYPAAGTFFLFGLLAMTQRGFADLYAALVGQALPEGDDKQALRAEEGLVPTLIGVLLVLASLPFLALMWGARVTDLSEVWNQVRGGFMVGEVRISPTEFFTFLLVFVIGYLVTRLIQGGLRNTILPKTKLDIGARTAIVSGVGYLGIFLAAIAAITTAGIDMSSFAIFASALAVGIGFGLQTIVSNFVSGIILLIERPVAEGDWIEVGGIMGHVRSISVRATKIETFDRTSVIVPNADLVSGVVTNWTRGNSMGRVIVPVGVAYGTDTRWVEQILTEIANAHPMVVIAPPPSVLFMGFGADSLDFEIRAIVRDVNFSLGVKSDLNHEIARRFTEEGIEIPFAQRDVWLRNPETLQPARPAPGNADPSPRPLQADEVPGTDGGDGDGDAY